MSNRRPHVLIAGGGIGGLSAALALLQRDFPVDVYEQAAELEEVGAGVQLSPKGIRALHAMGVLDALEQLSCTAEGKEVRHWKTGESWTLFDLGAEAIGRYAFPYLTVWRPDLLETLTAAVRHEKPDAIHLSSRCTGFARTGGQVILLLDHGRRVLGDACHPTLPMLAQGAVMAIEDGFILTRCLECWPDDIKTAFTRYEEARRDRTRAIVLRSADNARRFHNPALADPVGAKEYLDREWSRTAITTRYEWLLAYDVLGAEI